jgi:hypothetical protein
VFGKCSVRITTGISAILTVVLRDVPSSKRWDSALKYAKAVSLLFLPIHDSILLLPGRGKRFFYTPQRPERLWGPPSDRSPPSNVEVKNGVLIPPFPHTSSQRGAQLSTKITFYISIYFCCSHLEHRASVKHFLSLQFLNPRQSVGLLGRGISPTEGHYLHRTTQTQNKRKHPCLEWDSNPRSHRSRGRRHFMP